MNRRGIALFLAVAMTLSLCVVSDVYKRQVFPRRDTLKGVYPYLEEQPWLLPAAWVHRLGRYALGEPGRGASARESVGIGTRRVALLRKYRVIP